MKNKVPLDSTPFTTHSPDETMEAARRLLDLLDGDVVLALHGQLGSGKTCFVQGLALALGVTVPVTSPTFTLINEYTGQRPLVHIDLYRVHSPEDLTSLGLDDYLGAEGVVAIEWAERAGDLLPASTVHIAFENTTNGNERLVSIKKPSRPGGGSVR